MTEVVVPQPQAFPFGFVNGVDENGNFAFSRVKAEGIDHTGFFGLPATSDTAANIEIGTIQTFELDNYNADTYKEGVCAQVTSGNQWVWGLVMAITPGTADIDGVIHTCSVDLLGVYKGGGDAEGVTGWLFEIKSAPLLGFSASATVGICTDISAVPALGQELNTLNVLAGRMYSANVSLLFSDPYNAAGNCFRLFVNEYDESTGDIERGVCTFRKTDGSTAPFWLVTLVPGPPSGSATQLDEITFFDEATSTNSATITVPANTEAGDVIVMADLTGSATIVIPSGFTEVTRAQSISGALVV